MTIPTDKLLKLDDKAAMKNCYSNEESKKKKELSKSIKRVYKKLSKLSDEELLKKLEKHKDGDFAKILLETNALSVGELKGKAYK